MLQSLVKPMTRYLRSWIFPMLFWEQASQVRLVCWPAPGSLVSQLPYTASTDLGCCLGLTLGFSV